VRRSILVDSKADILIYGNAERALVELSHRIAKGEKVSEIQDIRGTAFLRKSIPDDFVEIESTKLDRAGAVDKHTDPYDMKLGKADASCATGVPSPASGRGAGGEGGKPAPVQPIPDELLVFARELRANQTDAEELIWGLVRAKRFLGLKFRRQHPIKPYVIDFYCDSLKLAIELDGGQHAENVNYDEKRAAELRKLGIETLRFWNNEVLANTECVLEALYQKVVSLQNSAPSPLAPLPLAGEGNSSATIALPLPHKLAKVPRDRQVVRLPAYEEVSQDPVLYAHASRVLHLEANPGNARALVQRHGDREVWLNPPPIPLTTKEMDYVYDMPYARKPHPIYKNAKIIDP
jgi:very-short-patch-repair endonuclease